MTEVEKSEWFCRFKKSYLSSSTKEKSKLLDSVEETLGIHRKSAIRLLRKKSAGRPSKTKRGPRSKYDHPEFIRALKYLWKQTKYMNSRSLLKTQIPIQGATWNISEPAHPGVKDETKERLIKKPLILKPPSDHHRWLSHNTTSSTRSLKELQKNSLWNYAKAFPLLPRAIASLGIYGATRLPLVKSN